MSPGAPNENRQPTPLTTLDVMLQLGVVALLIYFSARILTPFASILIWSTILAVMIYPLHLRLRARIGNRWSALLIGAVGIVAILVPMVIAVASIGSSIYSFITHYETITLPPPPRWLAELPYVGQKLSETWSVVASNMPAAIAKYGQTLSAPAAWLASFAGNLAASEISFMISFAFAAVLVAYGEGSRKFAHRLMQVLTGAEARGARLLELTAATIRGVALGVVGVAAVQSLLIGIGFFAIGLPAAGLLTLGVFLLAVVQIPVVLLTLPVVVYVFATQATTPAVIFLIWNIFAGLSDNLLRPLMLGRGLETPMPIILIGVLGGVISDGLLGLFIGPVLLSVAYVLFMEWLRDRSTM